MKINPYFEVKGTKYEIKRTRYLESEYDKITSESKLSDEQQSDFVDYAKLESEYTEILEKYSEAKDDYFDDVLNEEKEKKYLAFKKLSDSKYNEMKEFEMTHKNISLKDMRELAYENGIKLLYVALQEQYQLSQEQAKMVWEDFVDHFGKQTSMEWILVMTQSLFERDEEEENPFLKQAKAKAMQKAEQRKGLSKIKK